MFLLGIGAATGGVWLFLDFERFGNSAVGIKNTNAVATTIENTNSENATASNINSTISTTDTNSPTTENPHLPKKYSLDVPYTPQAPHGIWDLPYKEACEEASMLMVGRYLTGRTIADAEDADRAILQLVDYVEDQGYPIDITAEETAKLLHDFYDVETDVVYDFTWDQVKEAISSGYPVIVPAAGRNLGNPNYTTPGPLYHMLVIVGYTETKVITNDPGTKRGEGYTYDYETVYNAVHDWNGGNVESGRTVMIVARPEE